MFKNLLNLANEAIPKRFIYFKNRNRIKNSIHVYMQKVLDIIHNLTVFFVKHLIFINVF